MTMEHKAFKFDWSAFKQELLPTLERALNQNEIEELRGFIVQNRSSITDPYEGKHLGNDWESTLENLDAHEYGDFALTKYYDPLDEHGVQLWSKLSDELPPDSAEALLGFTVGPEDNRFDPGRMGSYFKDHEMVRQALSSLKPYRRNELRDFISMLRSCMDSGYGVYITF